MLLTVGTDLRAISASLKMITFKIQSEWNTQNKNLFALYDVHWNTQSKNLFGKGVRFLWRRDGLWWRVQGCVVPQIVNLSHLLFLFFIFYFFKKCLLGIFLAWIIKDVCF